MAAKQIYFSDEEEVKIRELAKKWRVAEYEVVRKIIREYKEGKSGK
jgi:Mor family transcriptional regulator